MLPTTEAPFPQFFDLDGNPLDEGSIYYGTPNANPVTSPIPSFWDTAGTQPAAQPIKTLNGYPVYFGTPANVFVSTAYSVSVYDKKGRLVYYAPDSSQFDQLPSYISDIANKTDPAKGSALVGYKPPFTGSVGTTVSGKLSEIISVKDFGAVGDGVANDTPAIQAALNSLGTPGGIVYVNNGFRCLIDTALNIPVNCVLAGPRKVTGSPGSNSSTPYNTMGAALLVNSSVTITLASNSSLSGLLIYRKLMVFPAADSGSFAGTAITAGGDDVSVIGCMVLGFNKAFFSSGCQRPRIEYMLGDNNNGIEITNCLDICYISNCHMWPFASIAAAGLPSTLQRSGKGYYIHDTVDWAKLTNCFSYAYAVGIQVTNANSTSLVSCGTDSTFSGGPLYTGSVGIQIDGTSTSTRLDSCQTSAQGSQGVYINTSAGIETSIINHNAWSNLTHGILVASGDAVIVGGVCEAVPNGISISSPGSRVTIDKVRFNTITSVPIHNISANTLVFIGQNDYGAYAGAVFDGTLQSQPAASAVGVTIPNTGDTFNITGTTNFGSLGNGWAGRVVTLVFNGALTVFNGTGTQSSIRLSGAANYTTTANGTLTLRHNGSQWFEIGRSA